MLLGTHLITGAVAGEYLDNPYLAFTAGIILHFIIDAIPHFDTTDKGKMTLRQFALTSVDFIVGAAILFIGYKDFSVNHWSYLAGAFGGIFPDLIDNVPFWQKAIHNTKIGKKFNLFHCWVHQHSLTPIPGILIQYLIIAVAVLILIKLK